MGARGRRAEARLRHVAGAAALRPERAERGRVRPAELVLAREAAVAIRLAGRGDLLLAARGLLVLARRLRLGVGGDLRDDRRLSLFGRRARSRRLGRRGALRRSRRGSGRRRRGDRGGCLLCGLPQAVQRRLPALARDGDDREHRRDGDEPRERETRRRQELAQTVEERLLRVDERARGRLAPGLEVVRLRGRAAHHPAGRRRRRAVVRARRIEREQRRLRRRGLHLGAVEQGHRGRAKRRRLLARRGEDAVERALRRLLGRQPGEVRAQRAQPRQLAAALLAALRVRARLRQRLAIEHVDEERLELLVRHARRASTASSAMSPWMPAATSRLRSASSA